MISPDAVIVGAGQAGLAAARALLVRGLRPVVLEAGDEPVGSWPRYYDSLTLFSPARYCALPGLAFPGDPDRYPRRDEVVDYLRRYAATLDVDIRTGQRALAVHSDGAGFAVRTATQTVTAPAVIAATGGFGDPHRPALPGIGAYAGEVLHASQYRSPHRFAGQHVMVVGAGNSAVQIAVELAHEARVTLATRNPVRYAPRRPLGRDIHFWSTRLGIDHLPVGPLLRAKPAVPVLDDGAYRAALAADQPPRRALFTGTDGTTVIWSDGSREHVDAILLATGYRPAPAYLAPLDGALDTDGSPRQHRGVSTSHPGLGYVGLEWQRSLASATLRGVGRDAEYVVDRLFHARRRCCARATTAAAR